MNEVPTAEEFIINWTGIDNSTHPNEEKRNKFIQNKNQLIEFAKLHVKAALEAAAENHVKLSATKDTIRNAYPEDLIK